MSDAGIECMFATDSGNLAILTLLDLSAAFGSVDHDTLSDDCRRRQLVHLLFTSRGADRGPRASPYLQPLSRYWARKITGSRP